MQVWLEPILELRNDSHPMCAVLTRLGYALDKANIDSEPIMQLAQLAARLFPGNLQACAGNLDSDSYAAEVIRTERDRVDFPRHLRHELDQINTLLGQGPIDWCLPVLEPEFFIGPATEFARQFVGQNWMTIYLVTDIDLFNHLFPRNNNIVILKEATFQAMQITPGIPPSFHQVLPVPSFPMPTPSPIDPWWEEEEKPQEKSKPLPLPQHRSIYDESTPSW